MSETLERPLMGVRIFSVDDDGYIGSLTGRGGRWEPDMPQRAKCESNGWGTYPGMYSVRYAYYNPNTGRYYPTPETTPEKGSHEPPHDNCGCGYYAWYGLQTGSAIQSVTGGVIPNPGSREYGSDHVRAVVSAWGDVVLHETGYRSEWMQIEAFIVDTSGYKHFGHWIDLMPAWEALAHRYAVPLLDEEDVDEFCRERGEVLNSRDLAAERFQQASAELRKTFERMSNELLRISANARGDLLVHGSRESGRKPTSFQEAIEKKRNKPAFWRDYAGGDVHNG